MKKETIVIGYLSLFIWAIILLLQTKSNVSRIWGEIKDPNGEQHVILYQKDRMMHQTPEILLYYQGKDQGVERYLGGIILPEDNRSKIKYTYKWTDKEQIVLSLECDYCMIEQRHYHIALAETAPNCITALPITP